MGDPKVTKGQGSATASTAGGVYFKLAQPPLQPPPPSFPPWVDTSMMGIPSTLPKAQEPLLKSGIHFNGVYLKLILPAPQAFPVITTGSEIHLNRFGDITKAHLPRPCVIDDHWFEAGATVTFDDSGDCLLP